MRDLKIIQELAGASLAKGVLTSYNEAKLLVESIENIEQCLNERNQLIKFKASVVDHDKPETPSEKG